MSVDKRYQSFYSSWFSYAGHDESVMYRSPNRPSQSSVSHRSGEREPSRRRRSRSLDRPAALSRRSRSTARRFPHPGPQAGVRNGTVESSVAVSATEPYTRWGVKRSLGVNGQHRSNRIGERQLGASPKNPRRTTHGRAIDIQTHITQALRLAHRERSFARCRVPALLFVLRNTLARCRR